MTDKFRVGILTVSDRCFSCQSTDTSGPNLQNIILQQHLLNADVTVTAILPDEQPEIENILKKWSDDQKLDLILTTGGTGFAPRDVTPEATRCVIHKEAPGLSLAMLQGSLEVTPLAVLSRAVCGIRHRTLIVNLPGSRKASDECFRFIVGTLPHALSLLRQDVSAVEKTHSILQQQTQDLKETPVPTVVPPTDPHRHHHHHHHCPHSSVRTDQVVHRPRQSQYPMITVSEAQKIVLEQCQYLLPAHIEEIPVDKTLNRVLAQDCHALVAIPPFPASAKDGYAVLAADGPGKRKVLGSSVAGTSVKDIQKVESGTCARINTGAPVPPGADAVVMVEDTRLLATVDHEGVAEESEIEIMSQEVLAGQDIRPIGSDVATGQLVLPKGRVISAADIGLLASVGVVKVKVHKIPTVAVMSTGNEVLDTLKVDNLENQQFIGDSNRPTLLSLLKERGFPVFDAGIAPDEPSKLLQCIQNALAHADVLVTTGGVSMGERDYLRQVVLADLSSPVLHFARVNMKPGKPTTFLTCQYENKKKLIFGLPGNPVSAVVTSHLYVVPACKRLAGVERALPTVLKAKFVSDEKVYLDPRPEYHRVRLNWDKVEPSGEYKYLPAAESTGNQMSSRLLSMVEANGLAILPAKTAERPVLEVGDNLLVDVLVIDRV